VPLSGEEVVAIARALALPPSSFARLGPESDLARAVRLEPASPTAEPPVNPPTFAPALRKAAGRCCFAHEVHGNRHICGLSTLAPAACHGAAPREHAASERREGAVRARWHEALDAGARAVPEEVFFAFLFNAFDRLDASALPGSDSGAGP
jgi:hypothetical protein